MSTSSYGDSCNCSMEYMHINERLNKVEKKLERKSFHHQCKECKTWNNFESEITVFRCRNCDVLNVIVDGVNAWQELKIDDLPGDIFGGSYQFRTNPPEFYFDIESHQDMKSMLLCLLEKSVKYEYRKRQPEKKEPSHEELAEDYLKGAYLKIPLALSYTDCREMVEDVKAAFVAGRKSLTPPEQ